MSPKTAIILPWSESSVPAADSIAEAMRWHAEGFSPAPPVHLPAVAIPMIPPLRPSEVSRLRAGLR